MPTTLTILLCSLWMLTVVEATPVRIRLIKNDDYARSVTLVASTQMGKKELTGANDGPHIDAYLQAVGLAGKGYAYCYAFVYWCANEASCQMSVPNPFPKTGSTQTAFSRALKLSRHRGGSVSSGDVLIWRTPKSWTGHAAIIESITSHGWVTTLEGNTTPGRSSTAAERNGGGNYRRLRCLSAPLGRMYLRGVIGLS